MTNDEVIESAEKVLAELGYDVRKYADSASMTNCEKKKRIEELKTLLGKAGCNQPEDTQTVIGQKIRELRQVENSLN